MSGKQLGASNPVEKVTEKLEEPKEFEAELRAARKAMSDAQVLEKMMQQMRENTQVQEATIKKLHDREGELRGEVKRMSKD